MYACLVTDGLDYLGELDREDPRTASQQIADRLRAAILTGKFRPGEKLPSQLDLTQRYGVARETVRVALRLLEHERLITSRQGSGVFVRHQAERPAGLRPLVETAFDRLRDSKADLDRAFTTTTSAIDTDTDLDDAFKKATELTDIIRRAYEAAGDLRAQLALKLYESEKMSLAVLGHRISVSATHAAELLESAKGENDDSGQA